MIAGAIVGSSAWSSASRATIGLSSQISKSDQKYKDGREILYGTHKREISEATRLEMKGSRPCWRYSSCTCHCKVGWSLYFSRAFIRKARRRLLHYHYRRSLICYWKTSTRITRDIYQAAESQALNGCIVYLYSVDSLRLDPRLLLDDEEVRLEAHNDRLGFHAYTKWDLDRTRGSYAWMNAIDRVVWVTFHGPCMVLGSECGTCLTPDSQPNRRLWQFWS